MTLDTARGLLYLPVSTPSNDFYGGRRPRRQSLRGIAGLPGCRHRRAEVAHQIVHHGLWDYDLPSPPNLVSIDVAGRRIDAVAQLTKMGWAFVFDRVTGDQSGRSKSGRCHRRFIRQSLEGRSRACGIPWEAEG